MPANPSQAPKPVLLLAYYYLPWNTSGVQRALRLAKYLPEYGYAPYVVASSDAGSLAGAECVAHVPNERTTSVAGASSRRAQLFQRQFLPYDEKLPWVPHAMAAARDAMAKTPFSAVISTSPPLATHMAAALLKRRFGLPWIADFRDPLVGNPGRPRRWAQPYDVALQRWFFSGCDAAIAVTDVVAGQWRRRYPRWSHKFHLVWNGFDPEESVGAQPLPPRPYRVLTHAGVIYTQRHPFWLADSLDRLVAAGKVDPATVRLRLVGEIAAGEVFRAQPAVARLSARGCVEYAGQVPRADAMREVATADYLLVLDITNLSEIGYTVPAKLYDYIRIGRPILAYTPAAGAPTARILQQAAIPHVLIHPGESEAAIDAKLLAFLAMPSDPVPPSPWFDSTFDGRQQAGSIAALLDGLV